MKTAHTALSLGLAVVIALSVLAMPATFYGFRTATAQTILTMETSADDHADKFFGNNLLQVIIEDSTTDDAGDDIQVSIQVRDDTGTTLVTTTKTVVDTTTGSQRFEFFVRNDGSGIAPSNPEATSATIFDIGGAGSDINIGGVLDNGYTIKFTYKTLSSTITYDDQPSSISVDRDNELYGSDNSVFLTIEDQDGNGDPTARDNVTANTDFVTATGALTFDVVGCTETGDNTAEFECEYLIGDTLTVNTNISSVTVVIHVQDASKYMEDDGVTADVVTESGSNDISITVEDDDGVLTDPGSITFGGELKLKLTDIDRNLSSKSSDDVDATQGTFAPGDAISTLASSGARGVVVYSDVAGGDFVAVPMTEDDDNSGVFVPDLSDDEVKITFLAQGESSNPNNSILELNATEVNEDIVIAYIDAAADSGENNVTTSTIVKELTTVPGKVTVDETAGINADFTFTLTDSDLNNNAKSKDVYALNFTGTSNRAPANEFALFRGGHSLGTGVSQYSSIELEVAGDDANFNTGTLPVVISLTETGANTGIFTAKFDMADILDHVANGGTVDDGDTLKFTINDYMEDPSKSSSDELTVGRATAGVDLSREDVPIPPATTGVIATAIGSDEVSVDLMISDDDVNENTGSQDTLTLNLTVGAQQNFRVEVDSAGFDATDSDADGTNLAGKLGCGTCDLSDILSGGLQGLDLKETGSNTGVFSETLTFVRGPLSLDDWQDMRISFVYIQPDGDEESAGITFRGHDAVVDVDAPSVKSHTMMTMTVQDEDLNLDDTTIEEFDCSFDADVLFRVEAENDDIGAADQPGDCGTFTETGEDTGVFTAEVEVGTDIKIVNGDDQASNLHLTYADEIDSSGSTGDDVEIDVPVVSGTGAINTKPDLVGPGTEITVLVTDTDLDEKPSGKDTIDANIDTLEIKSDRREVGKTSVEMEETGVSTGVFQFTIQLITDASDCADDDLSLDKYDAHNSGDKAEIGACPGDLIAIKYEDQHDASGRSAVVSQVVEVKSWDPEFKADKDSYNVGDKATVSISDPDANRDADIADTLRDIRVTSTSDQVGEELSAIETGKDTGVFKLSFGLAGSATSGGIFVKKGDTVSITYTDDFPANFVEIENDKDFKFTLSVSGTGASPTATTPSAPIAKDLTGKVVTSVTTGQQVLLATTIINTLDQDLPYVALIEVRDSSGVTVAIGFSTGTLKANDRSEVGQSWTPQESGSYNVRTFVISSLDKPQILSKVEQSTLPVS